MPRSPVREEKEDREERRERDSKRMHVSRDRTAREKRDREPERDRERERNRGERERPREHKEREDREIRDRSESNNNNKRRREEDDRDTHRDNRPKYYQQTNPNIPRALMDKEVDEKKLSTRQKQIDFGKNTIGYQRYLEEIPKPQRKRTDIWTPEKTYKCSKRSWDGQVRQWRRLLHEYDPPAADGEIEIDLDNDEDDISRLQKELDDERDADNKENDKAVTNQSKDKTEAVKVEKAEVKIESPPRWKTTLPFMEPLENEKWADMV